LKCSNPELVRAGTLRRQLHCYTEASSPSPPSLASQTPPFPEGGVFDSTQPNKKNLNASFTKRAHAWRTDYDVLIMQAHKLAANAAREIDRQFWMNVAKAWANLRKLAQRR
jgi:hypothetical protein